MEQELINPFMLYSSILILLCAAGAVFWYSSKIIKKLHR